jgi:hypothetical protein
MLAWQPEARSRPSASGNDPPRRNVARFLIDSEQRVIAHCVALLAKDVTAEERRRLGRVLAQAETRLRQLRDVAA